LADITIVGDTLETYQFSGTTHELRIKVSEGFTASDGTAVNNGEGFYQSVSLTSGGVYSTFSIKSTRDGVNLQNCSYTFQIWIDGEFVQNYRLDGLTQFIVPATPTTTTLPDLATATRAYLNIRGPRNLDGYYTDVQTDARIAAQLATGGVATTTTIGRVKLASAPLDAASPYAVETTDTRLPTQTENDALAGTSGTPSSSNKYVTNEDARLGAGSADLSLTGTNNATTDTAAITAAVNALLSTGGRIRLNGTFTSNAITFSQPSIDITLEINGTVNLNGTWQLPSRFHLEGIGKSAGTSRFYTNVGKINGPTTANTPGILYDNQNGPNAIRRMTFASRSANAAVVKVHGGSSKTFKEIGIDLNASGSMGFEFDTCFWIDMEEIGIVSSPGKGYTIHLTFTGGGGYIGLIRMKQMQLWNKGVKLDGVLTGGGVPTGGNVEIENVELENADGPLFDADLTNFSAYGHVRLKDVGFADILTPGMALVKVRHATGEGPTLTSLEIDGFATAAQPLLDVDRDIPGLKVWSPINTQTLEGNPIDFGVKQRRYTHEAYGRIDAIWDGAGAAMGPAVVPYASLATNQDASTWAAATGSGTFTTGRPAPDGSPTAAKVVEATGGPSAVVTVNFYGATRTVSVGDWFIFGLWEKSASDTTSAFRNNVRLSLNPGAPYPQFDNTTNNVANSGPQATSTYGSSWKPLVTAAKVTQFSDGVTTTKAGVQTDMDIQVYNGSPAELWKPFLIHIPASAGFSDQDAIRYARFLTNVLADAPAGAVSLFPHQKLYFGGGTFATKPASPAQITSNQNDYNPGVSFFLRLSSDASRNVTGLSVSQFEGEAHLIVNVGSNDIVLKHQDAGSTAANRFLCSTGADITLTAGQAADVLYDPTTTRWRVFKRN
jgi:hypothetical protein